MIPKAFFYMAHDKCGTSSLPHWRSISYLKQCIEESKPDPIIHNRNFRLNLNQSINTTKSIQPHDPSINIPTLYPHPRQRHILVRDPDAFWKMQALTAVAVRIAFTRYVLDPSPRPNKDFCSVTRTRHGPIVKDAYSDSASRAESRPHPILPWQMRDGERAMIRKQ